MNYVLYDGIYRKNLLPFTYTRPVADIRVGILTIREKWEKLLGTKTSTLTKTYLQEKFPLIKADDEVLINASYLPTKSLVDMILQLEVDEAVYYQDEIVAVYVSDKKDKLNVKEYIPKIYKNELLQIKNTWDIFSLNVKALEADYKLLTDGRKSAPIPSEVHAKNPNNIFIEATAEVNLCSLNATDGPIYIGHNSIIMEGCMIRGGLAVCDGAIVKMGAKIYGGTTIGPNCKVGGEINNVVLFANSNKGHDGFLGNAVIGEWCNLGADTNNSNLKNNYAEVRLWDYETHGFAKTGLQFCGLMMGDHSKCSINTMFNTGTVIGVSANIFGDGFPRNFIPSFSWGGTAGYQVYQMKKVKEVAKVVMARRNVEFDAIEERILQNVFDQSQEYRNF